MSLVTKIVYGIMAAAVVAATVLMCGQYGLLPGLDFGCGQYYYTDIPGWEKYFSVKGVVDGLPRGVYYLLFFAWGYAMSRLWRWIDSRGDDGPKPGAVRGTKK